jgi:hypothetical protein
MIYPIFPRRPASDSSAMTAPAEVIVEFAIGEESGIAGDRRAVELQLDLAVEIDAQAVIVAVTHWVLGRSGRKGSGMPGFPGTRRKRHAETAEPSGKSGFRQVGRLPEGLLDARAHGRSLWNHRDALFTFLRQPGLDATNWRAELAIRSGVILRKVRGGSRT